MIGMEDYAVLLGGESNENDHQIYNFYPESNEWKRKSHNPYHRSGSSCARHQQEIMIYGGKSVRKKQKYTYSWIFIMISEPELSLIQTISLYRKRRIIKTRYLYTIQV